MPSKIKHISYYLPEKILTNDRLAESHPKWPMKKIYEKTGIYSRHIAASDEYSLDLGVKAAKKLFLEHGVNEEDIDFVLFCTQTPKFLVPTNACVLQEKLGLPPTIGALDLNQGCAGYIYGLMVANAMINSGAAKNILLVTADTYTKLVDPDNHRLASIFADGAAASLISLTESNGIQDVICGADGRGAGKLISKNSGMMGNDLATAYQPDLYMNGPEIFNFTLNLIPKLINDVLEKNKLVLDDIDHFIFHQANAYMLEHLREKIGIKKEKFVVYLKNIGNTISSSIPIALKEGINKGSITVGDKVLLVGFGVGLSWGASLIQC